MVKNSKSKTGESSRAQNNIWRLSAGALLISSVYTMTGYSLAAPLTLNVIGADGTPVTGYRWTVEEDATKASVPGQHATRNNYSFSFHSSYMPVVAAGKMVAGNPLIGNDCADPDNPIACLDPDRKYQALPDVDPAKRYYVSVLPDDGYAMGGAPVVFDAAGNGTATVYVNKYPVPTAQISIFAFEDNSPLNAAPDLPQEQGLAGFTVFLTEAGGTYGGSGGQVTQDAFGNPLGTTYQYGPDGQPVLDAAGSPTVVTRGSGIIMTGPDGTATIKNLYPAKYTIQIIPPAGSDWHQTTTIEGTKGDDAWVKNGEPKFFQEFGPPGHHVFTGFTHSGFIARNGTTPVLNGTTSVTGRVTSIHNSRPPDYTFYNGEPVPQCWVGLNEPAGGRALYAAPCNADSTFAIPNVPAGDWELVVWDEALDAIIATATITVTPAEAAAGTKALGDVPVFSWFAKYEGRVFFDGNGNGFPDEAPLTGIADQALNIRFRDGSIYQSTLTKKDGTFSFNEVFPFFNWMIAEVDYGRFKATGATITVDAGGPVPAHNGWTTPSFNKLTPQTQTCTQDDVDANTAASPNLCTSVGQTMPYRVEQGVILLEGMQTFLGQTNHIEWGKKAYVGDENGGIAGIVQYGITRAEDDPKNGTAETWEPGIPRVQVNLFLDCDGDGKPDKPGALGNGTCEAGGLSSPALAGGNDYVYDPPDVDNYPFCWRDPASCGLAAPAMGPEDRKRSRTGGATEFSYGDVFTWGSNPDNGGAPYVGLGKTDDWDDALPTNCPTGPSGAYTIPYGSDAGFALDCYDGLRAWNQLRPAVFDGGYAFGSVAGQSNLPNVKYIVEAVAPPGYFHQGNGDKNVTFGDTLAPAPLAEPNACVGMDLPVPQYLTLFPAVQDPNPLYNPANPAATWKKCDMKAVDMQPGRNAAPNFFLYTEAPVAGHGVGFILDDLSSEFDVNAPTFGEKHAPPHLPVSISDWTGREISRVYADEFGSYNFLVPSSFTINPPFPSGVQPSMMVACMNSPGPIPDPSGAIDPNTGLIKMVIDPYFNRQYSQFCYTLQYLPGKTTYLDTPVVPVAAFAGRSQNPLDCDLANATPMIYSVTGANASGPYVPAGGGTLTLVSAGNVEVPNPYYDPAVAGSTKTLMRDYGFGAAGSVTLNGVPLTVNTWTNDLIQVTVPSGASTGELLVTRGSGAGSMTSDVGITVQVGGTVHQVPAGGSIQAVIDDPLTHDGDIVMVPPGTYNEYVIMDKRIKLQGWGAMSTTINAAKIGTTGLKKWRDLVNRKIDATPANPPVIDPDTGQNTLNPGPNRTFDVLPGQVLGLNVSNNEPLLFGAEEGPGVLVVGRATTTGTDGHFSTDRARIDGITITGADAGGGILASGYARFLEVSNNRIVSNYGTYGGGVRIGHTALLDDTNTAYGGYTNSQNGCLPGQSCTVGVNIHHNWIAENGSTEAGGGGGVSIGNGAGSYQVANNYICGNFSMADGGGIGHLGISNGGKIVNNKVIFNQTFNQSLNATGAGIYVGGLASLDATGLSPGTGNVTIDANLIQGNNAGAGAGGGVRLAQVNGLDVGNSPTSTTPWNQVTLTNNMIVDNVAAYAGGGVALVDALKVNASNNTIANNDSTATNMQSFANAGDTVSQPQPAGLVSFATSSAITSRLTGTLRTANRFSNPVLHNEIVWHNRSFCWAVTGPGPGEYGLFDANADGSCNTGSPAGTAPNYVDLAVLGTAAQGSYANKYVGAGVDKLIPDHSILSALLGTDGYQNNSNLEADPGFVSAYFNGSAKPAPIIPGYTTLIQTAATTDEGGNFIDIRFGPLTPWNCLTPTDTNGQPASQSNCPLYGDYHLASDASPAVNVGLSRVTGNGVPVSDFDSDPRPASAIDIGADERSLPRADLAIFNSDGQTSVTRGTSVTYNIVVSNLGPTPVTGAVVADARPAGITSASWNWTCAGAGCGPTGNSGTGNINKTLGTLAVNASVTFTATGTVSSTATSLSNTASVAAPNTVVDVVTANNSATDTDTILLGTASFSPNPVAFGNIATNTTATRTVTVTNTGTQPLVIASATVSGPRFGKGTDSCSGQTLPVNGTCTVNVTFNPNNNNQRRGALTLVHNGLNSPQSVVLSGQ